MTTTVNAEILALTLGSFSMTYSESSGTWCGERIVYVEIAGVEWGVELSLDDKRVVVYAFNDDGRSLFGVTGFAPGVKLGEALRSMGIS